MGEQHTEGYAAGASVSISRVTSNVTDDYMTIRIVAESVYVQVQMTLEDFARALTGQNSTPVLALKAKVGLGDPAHSEVDRG